MPDKEEQTIHIESVFGFNTRQPFVGLRWGNMAGQMTPAEARAHALAILECAEAAEQDAFMMHFLTDTIGAPIENAAQLLGEFRSQRGKFGDGEG